MLIINATVHTMEGVTIPNGYVAVTGDKIAKVGPMEEAPDHWEGETLDLSGVLALLAGRKGFLCQYDRAAGRDTVWSAACDLTRRRCLLAEGNPGRTAFREIPFPVERGDSRP